MPLILQIESSHPLSSVSLAKDGETQLELTGSGHQDHASMLAPMVRDLLDRSGMQPDQLDAVAVSIGPGSYTGLRIGLSLTKGLCHAADIPLIAVSTLASMSATAFDMIQDRDALYCPLIDARRMEVYTALLNSNGEFLEAPFSLVVDEQPFAQQAIEKTIHYFGSGLDKISHFISGDRSKTLSNFVISSAGMNRFAINAYRSGNYANLAYLEPEYLKEFFVTKPRQ